MTSAEVFVDLHRPYRKKYITKDILEGELFTGTAWSHRNDFLSDYLINEAIEGVLTLGYFASTITQLVGVDIDNHRNYSEGWLLNIYGQVVERFGVYPSVLVRSPRGLHAFWYLTQPYSTEIIKDYTKERLERPISIRRATLSTYRLRITTRSKRWASKGQQGSNAICRAIQRNNPILPRVATAITYRNSTE